VPAERIEALKAALLAHPANPHAVAASFAEAAGPAPTAERHEAIDQLFAFDTVEEIFAALEADGSDWALAQLAVLKTTSPQSLKVSLRQIRTGARLTTFNETRDISQT
jgi:enoyl-CoA hydratase